LPLTLYARTVGVELQGWITNLLVKPEHRGRGYAQLLLAAADAWFLTVMKGETSDGDSPSSSRQEQPINGANDDKLRLSMHLHCDANSVSGKGPQALYKKCGYEEAFVMQGSSNDVIRGGDFSWLGPETLSSSVVVIDGVPLLYLRKNLSS